MFETHDHAEIPLHPEFRDSGERLWSYVRTRLHVPWLHVVYGITQEEDGEPITLREMVFLSEVRQLEELLLLNARLSLLAVDLMSPGHLNGSGRWQLEPLAEIWEGTVPDTEDQRGYVYVLRDGRRYVDAAGDTPEDRLLNRRCVLTLENN